MGGWSAVRRLRLRSTTIRTQKGPTSSGARCTGAGETSSMAPLERALVTHFHHFHPLCCNSSEKYTFKVQSHGQRWRYFSLPSRVKGGKGGVGPSEKGSSQGEVQGTPKEQGGGASPSDRQDCTGGGKGVRDTAQGNTPFARNVVAIGEGAQGGFEGVIASNRAQIPRDRQKHGDPQEEARVYQETLLEASQQ